MKWRITRLVKATFEYWDDQNSQWTGDAGRATQYDSKPVVHFQSTGGRCWTEIIRGTL